MPQPPATADCALRPLVPADSGWLAAIHAQAFPSPWPVEAFQTLIPDPVRLGWAAVCGDEPAGFIFLQQIGEEAEILTFAVRPDFQSLGIGRALLSHAIAHTGSRGAIRMVLEVEIGNAAALALYRGFGFQEVGRRTGYYTEGPQLRDALILSLDIGKGLGQYRVGTT